LKRAESKVFESVDFHTSFLSDEESFKILDNSDLIALPYGKTQESSSASCQEFALSTTWKPGFNNVPPHQIPNNSKWNVWKGIIGNHLSSKVGFN